MNQTCLIFGPSCIYFILHLCLPAPPMIVIADYLTTRVMLYPLEDIATYIFRYRIFSEHSKTVICAFAVAAFCKADCAGSDCGLRLQWETC